MVSVKPFKSPKIKFGIILFLFVGFIQLLLIICLIKFSIVPLKLTNLTSDILKCGFPVNALERYLTIFKNLSFKIKIIEEKNINVDKVIKKIKNINIEKTTPIKAWNILNEIKGMLNEWIR